MQGLRWVARAGLGALVLLALLVFAGNGSPPPHAPLSTAAVAAPAAAAGQTPPPGARLAAAAAMPAVTPSLSTAAPPPALAAPEGQLASWSWAAYGQDIGRSGIIAARVGSGVEVYTAGTPQLTTDNAYWYALRWNREAVRFDQIYVSDRMLPGIRQIVVARTNAVRSRDERARIVVGLIDGSLRIYSQKDKSLQSSVAGACMIYGGLVAMTAADLNGDGSDEIISVCSNQALVVQDERSTTWGLPNIGGAEIVVGQMDDDGGLEIATTSGRVIDVDTRSVQWTRGQAFGKRIQAADIDGDGRAELIASEDWFWVRAFDVEQQAVKWSLNTGGDLDTIHMADIDNDGVLDLLVGDGQWGKVSAYDALTLQPKGDIDNPYSGVTNLAVADLDGDGRAKVLWGGGAGGTFADYLVVADWPSRQIRWKNEAIEGPFFGPLAADLDGDGVAEIVIASKTSDGTAEGGRIIVFDSRTLAVRAISPPVAGVWRSTAGINDLKLRDIDGDGRPEIVVATDWTYAGLIEAYSFSPGSQFTLVWSNATRPSGSPFHSVEVADVDGDGRPEVLAGNGYAHSDSNGYRVYAYDVQTGAEKWHTINLGDTIRGLAVGDFDGNGTPDFAAAVHNAPVYIFNGPAHGLDNLVLVHSTSLSTVAASPWPKLLIGEDNGWGNMVSYGGDGSYHYWSTPLAVGALDGINVGPFAEWWVGSGGRLSRFSNGSTNFQSAAYGSKFGRDVVVGVGDTSWVFSAGLYGLHRFTVSP